MRFATNPVFSYVLLGDEEEKGEGGREDGEKGVGGRDEGEKGEGGREKGEGGREEGVGEGGRDEGEKGEGGREEGEKGEGGRDEGEKGEGGRREDTNHTNCLPGSPTVFLEVFLYLKTLPGRPLMLPPILSLSHAEVHPEQTGAKGSTGC